MKKYLVITSFFLSLYNCTYVSEEDLIDAVQIPDLTTYNNDVKPIIDNNCIVCHDDPPINGAPMPLLLYEDVKDAVENRNLIGRISSDDLGFSMPFGGPKLPQNIIDIVIKWEADGLLEE